MNLKIEAEKATIERGDNFGEIIVALEDVNEDELLDKIKDNGGGLGHIGDYFGPGDLLGEIGRGVAKQHFNLVDKDA